LRKICFTCVRVKRKGAVSIAKKATVCVRVKWREECVVSARCQTSGDKQLEAVLTSQALIKGNVTNALCCA